MPRTERSRQVRRQLPTTVTIRDVAHRAGVSTATVSRALAHPERVAEATRSAVFTAIAATGYTPNASARNLRARSTRMVLALIPGMSNTFFNPILNAFEDVLSEAGYGLIIGDTRDSIAREAHYARLIRAGQVDGLALFTGHLPHDEDSVMSPGQIPIALICNEIPGEDALSVFDVANRQAARAAVEHLIAFGHRRIAHIGGSPLNVEARERRQGYIEAMTRVGLAVEDALMWGDSFLNETGVYAAARYLALDDRPTAVFAASDATAISFIKTLREAGVRTPRDVSVVGFDDLDYAGLIDPPLTTMHQPRADLGRAAAMDLLNRMTRDGRDLSPTRVRLPCQLISRESVRSLGSAKAGTAQRQPRRASLLPATPTSQRAS